MAGGLKDGLTSLEVLSDTVSGTLAAFGTVSGATLVAGAGEIGNAELADNAVSGTKIVNQFGTIGTGSPIVYGLSAQAGSGVTSAGSNVWVVYGKPFAGKAFVTFGVQGADDRVITHVAGSNTAGSFFAISHGGASVTFDWQAIGSGRP